MRTSAVENSFKCVGCGRLMPKKGPFGTAHRNHCPYCGFSLHVDDIKGDRKSSCLGLMVPIGLTFKAKEEICLVHKCDDCAKINYNRIAADDDPEMILSVLRNSYGLNEEIVKDLEKQDIFLLNNADENKVRIQMYGKTEISP